MSLKLEVGKTYLSREGDRVGIVEYIENNIYHEYRGDNGETYHEGGRWDYCGDECVEDLISEYVEETIKEGTMTFNYEEFKKGRSVIDEDGNIVNFVSDFEGRTICIGEVVYNTATTALCFVHLTGYVISQEGVMRKVVSMVPKKQRVYIQIIKNKDTQDVMSYSHIDEHCVDGCVMEVLDYNPRWELAGKAHVDIELED